MGVQLREAPNFSQLFEPQHHCSQPVRHVRLPVRSHVLVEADRRVPGGECLLTVESLLAHAQLMDDKFIYFSGSESKQHVDVSCSYSY